MTVYLVVIFDRKECTRLANGARIRTHDLSHGFPPTTPALPPNFFLFLKPISRLNRFVSLTNRCRRKTHICFFDTKLINNFLVNKKNYEACLLNDAPADWLADWWNIKQRFRGINQIEDFFEVVILELWLAYLGTVERYLQIVLTYHIEGNLICVGREPWSSGNERRLLI